MVLEQKVKQRILEIRNTPGLLDADLADIYGVKTAEINQAVKNNPKKLIEDLYYFELDKTEKKHLIETQERLEKLKFSPHLPKFFNRFGIIMLSTILTSDVAVEVCHVVVRSFVEKHTPEQIEELLQKIKEQGEVIHFQQEKITKQEERINQHDLHIQVLAEEIYKIKAQTETRNTVGFQLKNKEDKEEQ